MWTTCGMGRRMWRTCGIAFTRSGEAESCIRYVGERDSRGSSLLAGVGDEGAERAGAGGDPVLDDDLNLALGKGKRPPNGAGQSLAAGPPHGLGSVRVSEHQLALTGRPGVTTVH